MYIIDVLETIESINIKFEIVKKTIFDTKEFELKNLLTEQVRAVEEDLLKLNVIISKLSETSDKSFLSEYEVGSYPLRGAVSGSELYLSEVSGLIHNLEVSFGELYNIFVNSPDLHGKGFELILSIHRKVISLIHAFNDTEEKHSGNSNFQNKIISESINFVKKELDSKLSNHKKASEKMLKSFESQMQNIEITAEQEFKDLNVKVNEIKEIYDTTLNELQGKHDQMDEMLGQSANRVMAQDYDTSASHERKAANKLRYGSIGCMIIIIGIVCYSFYDSTHSGFDWESSIFRTVLVFILSIPAAYLSRESAKHREQQYNYHHTALDLKAITPYIASLPEADQNRIKISIAERIFASRQTNVARQDSFPLNTQELMMELIKKVDFKKEDKKDTQVVNEGK